MFKKRKKEIDQIHSQLRELHRLTEGIYKRVTLLELKSTVPKWGEIRSSTDYYFPFEDEKITSKEKAIEKNYMYWKDVGKIEVWVQKAFVK